MLVFGLTLFGDDGWSIWGPVGVGAFVTILVIGGTFVYQRWNVRTRRAKAAGEDGLPWVDLMSLLDKYNRERATTGLPPEEPTEDVLVKLLLSMPKVPRAKAVEATEDPTDDILVKLLLSMPRGKAVESDAGQYLSEGGAERRQEKRRWGNPTEVFITSTVWPGEAHGLIVTRSNSGLSIFLAKEIEVEKGLPLNIRAAEAPTYVQTVVAQVRHFRKLGKGYLLGCEFTHEVPWNVRVWFG
jgi:hypothetical protein